MVKTTPLPVPPRTSRPLLNPLPAEAEPMPGGQIAEQPSAALLPEKILQPGEIIILFVKPSPWYILLTSLGSLGAILMILLAFWIVNNYLNLGVRRVDLLLVLVVLVGIRLFWQFLEWLSRIYVLTDRRVVRVFGVLRVHVFETQLENIQHTTAHYSIRERFFGLGTIGFTTAGTGFTEAYWQMVANPRDVHQKIIQALNRYR